MGQDTRSRLLIAAERLIIDEGVKAISIRRIAAETGLNSALTRYYFGSVDGLLLGLAKCNLEPMAAAWDTPMPADADVPAILRRYFEPMWLPAAHCHEERALVVVDELVAHGETGLRDYLLPPLLAVFERIVVALTACLPALGREEVADRLAFLTPGALGMPPRSRSRALLFAGRRVRGSADDAVRFAATLLTAG